MTTELEGITLITGTDTEVGKTIATAALAATLSRRAITVAVCKPAQTGVLPDEQGDLAVVQRLTGLPRHQLLEGVRLAEPLAPTTAARRAGVPLPPVRALAEGLAQLGARYRAVLVEGSGGLLVGLDDDGSGLVELADALVDLGHRPRFIVVTRPGLGTLNHTALTVGHLRGAGHRVAGLVLGTWPERPSLAERCNAADLERIAPIIAVLPEGLGRPGASTPDTLAASWQTRPTSFTTCLPTQETS